MGNNSSISFHSNVLIGNDIFIWGGGRHGIPTVHDSPEKRQFTSSITVYNILQSSLDSRQTTGIPPNATLDYSSCCIGEDIYYFGGSCEVDKCYHNNLFVLNTKTYEWREIDCNDGPMKKGNCGMIHLHMNGEDYLLVIGGRGLVPTHDTPDHCNYTLIPNESSHFHTNEVHIMCVSSTPGKWTVPIITGSNFPPLAWFSVNSLSGNQAIVFGGLSIVRKRRVRCTRTNDVFILTYSAINNSLNIQKLVKPPDPIQWPVKRSLHSSVIITSGKRKRPHLLVMGGLGNIADVIHDTWILSIDNMKWNIVVLPEVVANRYAHSLTSFKMSSNCVWLLPIGGVNSISKLVISNNIIELAFCPFDDNWKVSKIFYEEDVKNKAHYAKLVSDRLTVREKEYQLIMESTVPSATAECGLNGKESEQIELLKQQLMRRDEENQKIIQEMHGNLERKNRVIFEREEIIKQAEETIRNKEKLLEDTIRQKHDVTHQKEKEICIKNDEIKLKIDLICQKEELIQQKQCEIFDLRSQLENRPWVIHDEEVNITNTIIGGGAYGEVRVAVFRGTKVAAKRLHELIVSRHNKDIFTREMEMSSGIHHPNIVQFIGATRINNPILLYELMPTSLHKRLQDDESLTHAQIITIASNICSAMCYLHHWRSQPIIHRDISSPNVLMEPLPSDNWKAKLSDFGSANLQLHIKTVIPGNPAYAAPEALIPQHHSPAMDVYSFGVLITEMTLHQAPEMDSARRERRARSIHWVEMRGIVLKCMNNDRSQRLPSIQLLTELKKLNNLI